MQFVEGGAVTRTEFGFWLRGIASSSGSTDELAAVVLRKAQELIAAHDSGEKSATAVPAHCKPVAVPAFCAHNVHVTEDCSSCRRVPNGGQRVFILNLPAEARVVYIAGHAHGIVQDAVRPRRERSGPSAADAHPEPEEKILD